MTDFLFNQLPLRDICILSGGSQRLGRLNLKDSFLMVDFLVPW